jgi:hypothetical protein
VARVGLVRPEPWMTLPRTVADVLAGHVVFEVECIDRMYCNVYVPGLQYAGGLVAYVRQQLGLPVASTAPLARITDGFTAAVRRFAAEGQVPWVDFARGQRKDDVMHEHLAGFAAAGRGEGVVFIGRAQERTPVFRTEKRRDGEGKSYPWIATASPAPATGGSTMCSTSPRSSRSATTPKAAGTTSGSWPRGRPRWRRCAACDGDCPMWSTGTWPPTRPRTTRPRTTRVREGPGGDYRLQRGRPNPGGPHFGQATTRTRTRDATRTHSSP